MKPRLILHIGTHKTGTTTLQALMAAHRPALAAAGICYPDTTRSTVPHLPKHAGLFEALVAGPEAFAREHAQIMAEFARSGAHTLVLSEEGLSVPRHFGAFAAMARFARDLDITVVCCLRRQDLLAESLWNQYCREGHEKGQITDFIRRDNILKRLDYIEVLAFWQRIGTVRALSYDAAVRGEGLVACFAAATGIPLPPEDLRENVSPGMACAAVLAALNRRGIPADRTAVEHALGPGARRTALGRRLRRDLLDRFADVNAALAERFGIRFDDVLPDEPDAPLAAPDADVLWRFLPVDARYRPARGGGGGTAGLVALVSDMHARSGPLPWTALGEAVRNSGHAAALDAYRSLTPQGGAGGAAAAPCLPAGPPSLAALEFQSLLLTLAGEHDLYEALLRRVDPDLPLLSDGVSGRRFAASGLSKGTLKGYRRLTTPAGPVFEKIYRRSSTVGHNALFFHQRIQPLLKHGITTAQLRDLRQGARLAQVLVDHVDADRLRPASLGETVDVSLRLARLDTPVPRQAQAARYHATLEARPRFVQGWARLLAVLMDPAQLPERDAADIPERLVRLLEALHSLPCVFCHGDPGPGNILAGGMVIDWELCGRLPIGWDHAWTARNALREDTLHGALVFFDTFLRAGDATDDARAFGFLFFLMLFHALQNGRRARPELTQEVFLHLEDRRRVLLR